MNHFIKIAFQKSIIISSIKICIIVGTILNLINQGNVMISMNWEKLSIFRMMLTYSVPFCVATYSAAIFQIKLQRNKQML